MLQRFTGGCAELPHIILFMIRGMGDCWKLIGLQANLMIKEQTLLVSSIQGQRCEPLTYLSNKEKHCQVSLPIVVGLIKR